MFTKGNAISLPNTAYDDKEMFSRHMSYICLSFSKDKRNKMEEMADVSFKMNFDSKNLSDILRD